MGSSKLRDLTFPKFEKLHLKHKSLIDKYTSKFLPYSDYNFTSLWTYNTKNDIEISFLHNNLVVKFTDYITRKPFYSFLGKYKVIETINYLFNLSLKQGFPAVLKLVPADVVLSNKNIEQHFRVTEDLDNHDYIVSVSELKNLPITKYKRKKHLIDNFTYKYANHKTVFLDLKNTQNQSDLLNFFDLWKHRMKKNDSDILNEFQAIKRLFSNIKHFNIYALAILIDNIIVGFNIYEQTHKKYAISSFQKADKNYAGIYAKITHEAAKHLDTLGCQFINFEQDLGIDGLRLSKSLWKPVHYLKKYSIHKKK